MARALLRFAFAQGRIVAHRELPGLFNASIFSIVVVDWGVCIDEAACTTGARVGAGVPDGVCKVAICSSFKVKEWVSSGRKPVSSHNSIHCRSSNERFEPAYKRYSSNIAARDQFCSLRKQPMTTPTRACPRSEWISTGCRAGSSSTRNARSISVEEPTMNGSWHASMLHWKTVMLCFAIQSIASGGLGVLSHFTMVRSPRFCRNSRL